MAKSLRSKWKRKMRAIKRERYGKKELEKLKMIVNNHKINQDSCVEMIDISKISKVSVENITDETMETNQNSVRSVPNNNFPIWLGSSKRKKMIKRNRQIRKQKKKELKKKLKKY